MKGKHEMSQIEGDILDLMKLVITQCSFFLTAGIRSLSIVKL